MCLILCAYRQHRKYRLILAANRDEFYHRPTAAMDYWKDYPHILAGRDLSANGTWLAVATDGRLAAITNYRDPAAIIDGAPSRGLLVSGFLTEDDDAQGYLRGIAARAARYNGFNLLTLDQSGLFYYGNRDGRVRPLAPGLHALSNHLLNTPWPKVARAKLLLAKMLEDGTLPSIEPIFDLLRDQTQPPAVDLPDTGVGPQWERILAPMFIESDTYGTRSSTIVLQDYAGHWTVAERTYGPGTPAAGGSVTRRFEFKAGA